MVHDTADSGTSENAGSEPATCTLGERQLAERVLDWAALRGLAAAVDLRHDGGTVRFPAEHGARISDLVDRERSCCGSWMHLTLVSTERHLDLTVTTSVADGVEVIHAMFGPTP